jgi:hypothetical protein
MKSILTGFAFMFLLGSVQAQTPDDPTSLTATATSSSVIDLSWAQVNGTPAADGYVIYAIATSGTFPAASASPTNDTNLSDGEAVIKIVGNTTTSYNGLTGLLSGTSYTFRIYSYRSTNLSNNYIEASDFTYSAVPASHSALSAVRNAGDGNRIDLTFDAASTITNADGYLVYRKAGSAAVITGLADGAAPPATLNGGNTVLITTTNNSDVTYNDDGLTGGQTFHYVLVPFNWDGANAETYNFRTTSAPTASATTDLTISVAEIEGVGTNIATSPLGSASINQAILGFSITTDGPTDLQTLNIPLTGNPTGSFGSPRLYQSGNTSFGSDTNIGSGTLQTDHLEFTGLNYSLTAGTTNFFMVVNIGSAVNSSTPALMPSLTQAALTFATGSAAAFSFDGINYSFADVTPPAHVEPFSPADDAIQVSVALNQVVINFDEAVVNIATGADTDNNIRIMNVTDAVVHETINPTVAGKVTIAGPGNTQVTIALTTPFAAGKTYAVRIGNSVFEDNVGNNYGGITSNNTWNFVIETAPSISNFENANNAGTVTSACINDVVTINGSGFGTVSTPTVVINGTFTVAASDIISFTNTEIKFTLQSGAPNGTMTVRNNSNMLTSAASASSLTVLPAITTGLSVALTPSSPAQNNAVSVNVVGSEINLSYDLHLDVFDPDGTNPPNGSGSVLDTDTRADGSVDLAAGTLSSIGTYYYFIQARRTECTTRLITSFDINIAPLNATASASATTICVGETTTLKGIAQGGTGFNSFQWFDGATMIGTNANLDVSPASSKTYTLKVINSNGIDAFDDIPITVNPSPSAQFLAGIKSKFTNQDSVYRLSDSVNLAPIGGTLEMVGLAVSKHSDGKFYFDPKSAGTATDIPIYLSYTFNGCTAYDTLLVDVNGANVINGLDAVYCENITASDPLTRNASYLAPYSYQYWDGIDYGTVSYTYTFKRLALYRCDIGDLEPEGPANPLQPTGTPGEYILDPSLLAAGGYLYNCFYIIVVADTHVEQRDHTNLLVYDYSYSDEWATYQYFELRALNQYPSIVSIKEGQYICSDALPIELITDSPGYTTLDYNISNAPASAIVFNTGTSAYSFDATEVSYAPSDDMPRAHTITYSYNDSDGISPGCDNTVTRSFYTVPKITAPVVDDQTYCQYYEGRRVLKVDTYRSDLGTSIRWYDGTSNAVLGDGETYDTNISTETPISKTYNIRQIYLGCESQPDGASVIITPAPDKNVNFPSQCEDREGTFLGPTANVTAWEWDLGDGTTSNTQNVTHTYENAGIYNLVLILTSDQNGQVCSQTIKESIIVGQNPSPTLDYRFVCEGDFTEFKAGTADIPVVEFAWDFDDGDVLARTPGSTAVAPAIHSNRTTHTYREPYHQFQSPDSYRVKLTAYSNIGCYDTISKVVTVLDYLPAYTSDTPYIMANEEGGKGFWRVEDVNDSATWEFAAPSKTKMNSATPSWVTNATGSYKPFDISYVNSPCLDIRNISKPVVSLDYLVNTPSNTDGAVLEYSIDNGVTWKSVGLPGEGSNWFNTTGFFLGNVGSSPVGWSGEKEDQFESGKHALDNIPDFQVLANRDKVRFRIAFESDPSTEYEGFAFRNFNITKRNRTILVENFTNELDEDYEENNDFFTQIPGLETTRIQYHVSYPGDDSNSRVNVTDPSARAAFYGVVLSDGVIPRGYVDGVSGGNFTSPLWGLLRRDERSLIPSPFNITIDASAVVDGQLKISTHVQVLDNFAGHPILHVAIVEKTQGDNVYVLRKMLPNAAGTQMDMVLTAGSPLDFTHYFSTSKMEIDLEDLAVVVFIQDEITKQVYQSEINESPAAPEIVTGIETPEFAEQIAIYPNPADKEFSIELPEKTSQEINLRMIDSFGHEMMVPGFAKGQQNKTIHTKDLAAGLYILQLETGKGMVRKKVMVLHE